MKYLFAALVAILAAEILARGAASGVPGRMGRTARRSLATMSRREVSDHWKQRIVLHGACVLLVDALRIMALLGMLAGSAALVVVIAGGLGVALLEFLRAPVGLVYATAVAGAYLSVRGRRAR